MAGSPPKPPKGRPRGSGSFPWRAFFQQSRTPIFVLGKARRLRYANPAWETLTGCTLADSLGMVCSTRRHSSPLATALAPPPEVLAGTLGTARRPAPPLNTGPPWWDVTFAPLAGETALYGIVGFIRVTGEAVPAAARKIPAGVAAIRAHHASDYTPDLFAGTSAAMARFAARLRFAAGIRVPVWLIGEAGSGKETAARVLHHSSDRRERTFAAIDCSGLQPFLIESVLFGHGGLAHSERLGTLYLKEPAALPRDLQERVAELATSEQSSVPRLVCGSTRSAASDVAAGKLLPEFDTAFSVLEYRLPLLRACLPEIPRLVSQFLERNGDPRATVTGIDADVLQILAAYQWPGNYRELRQVLAEAALAAAGGRLTRDCVPHELRVIAGLEPNPPPPAPLKLDSILESVERRLIRLALRKSGGNATRAAESLGIWRTRLLRRVEALGIQPDSNPPATG